ncbi:hypothetical protein NMY22_g12693 [Coprinellus aureogranulatus]|nr:hypothetical protein NMY22_g12693 [Coprinellus aureogranulatus]
MNDSEASARRSPKITAYEVFQPFPWYSEFYQAMLYETGEHYVGPISVEEFFSAFMPWNPGVADEYKNRTPEEQRLDAIIDLPNAGEGSLCFQFISMDAFSDWTGTPEGIPTTPLIVKDRHRIKDAKCRSLGVDISIYGQHKEGDRAMDFTKLHSWVTLRPSTSFDPFDDNGEVPVMRVKSFSDSDSESEEDDEQSLKPVNTYSAYAGATMATQYLSHLFTVIVAGNLARLIRWDRCSAVVTEAFDITLKPLFLFEFFQRLRQLTTEQRGISPHVQPATAAEEQLARTLMAHISPELWLGIPGEHLKKSVDIDTQRFLKLTFGGRSFIIPSPHCTRRGFLPFGKGTRACVAVDATSGSLLFVKHYWRQEGFRPEATVYKRLEQYDVNNVPRMVCGGDLGPTTQGQVHLNERWVLKGPSLNVYTLHEHIIVLDTVGRNLIDFDSAHQLISCFADAMEAYEEALQKAQVMHCNISAHNILIVRDHISEEQPAFEGQLSLRVGTWRFMSHHLSENPSAKRCAIDSRESGFYVLYCIALHHLKHNMDLTYLKRMRFAFDYYSLDENLQKKGAMLMSLKVMNPGLCPDFEVSAVTDLIKRLIPVFQARYPWFPVPTPQDFMERLKQHCLQVSQPLSDPNWFVHELRATGKLRKSTGSVDRVENISERLGRLL